MSDDLMKTCPFCESSNIKFRDCLDCGAQWSNRYGCYEWNSRTDEYRALRQALDSRKELEAKLAKAVEALGGMIGLFSVDNVLRKGTHLNIELSHARTTLAELTKERSDEI